MESGYSLGDIIVRIKADLSDFKRGMEEAKGSTTNGMLSMAAAVAIGQAAFQIFSDVVKDSVGFVKDSISDVTDLGLEVRGLTAETGMSAEQVTGFIAVLDRFNISGQEAGMAIKKFSTEVANAFAGQSTPFDALGISVKTAGGALVDTNTLLLETADKFSVMSDGAIKTALATQLFGRQAQNLIPLLNMGSAGIQELEENAAKMGLVLTTSNAGAVQKYIMAQKDMSEAVTGVKLQIGLGLMPTITDLVENRIMPWIAANGGVEAIVKNKVMPVLEKLIGFIGQVIKIIGEAIGWYEKNQQTIDTTFKVIGLIIGGIIGVFVQLGQAIYAMVFYTTLMVLTVTDWINKLWHGIVDIFNALLRDVSSIFNAIWNAIKSAFNNVVGFIVGIFRAEWNGVTSLWNGIVGFFSGLVTAIKNAVSGVTGALTKPFGSAFDTIKQGVNDVVGFLGKLNPFQRHSPSLVDLVTQGTAAITDQYAKMFGQINGMAAGFSPAMAQSIVTSSQMITTNVNGPINIGSSQQADAFFKRLSRNQELAGMGLTSQPGSVG